MDDRLWCRLGEELFEEAFTIYAKFEKFDMAVDVLLENMRNFERAKEYAAKLDRSEVWSRLGVAMVENGMIVDGVNAIMKAKDPGPYMTVINCAKEMANDEDYEVSRLLQDRKRGCRQ